MPVTDYPARMRYELDLDGETAFATYRLGPGEVVIPYTEVPPHLRGRGIGRTLVRGVLEDIRRRGLKVVPRCGFVARFVRDNAEFHDLLK
jgi:predicted GNAT family acetyltransferase